MVNALTIAIEHTLKKQKYFGGAGNSNTMIPMTQSEKEKRKREKNIDY